MTTTPRKARPGILPRTGNSIRALLARIPGDSGNGADARLFLPCSLAEAQSDQYPPVRKA